MSTFRTALKEAFWVFVFSRLTILLVTYIWIVLFLLAGHGAFDCRLGVQPNPCLLSWYRWDSLAYVHIAFQGYARALDVVYFPLWPLLLHVGGLFLGGSFPFSYYLAGLLLSNICFYGALTLLYCLLCQDFEPSLAQRALFYLAFYPYALFFFAGYTESLFVLLCVAFFLVIRRGKPLDWWLAGGIGFLAALTRSTGMLLGIPFLFMYIRHFWVTAERDQFPWLQRLNALVPGLLIPAAVLGYALYLAATKGNPFLIQVEEAAGWHRHFAWIWTTYYSMLKILLTFPLFSLDFAKNLLDLAFTTVPIAALLISWKRLPLHYSLFAGAAAVFSLSLPQATINPMASQPRYMMSIFPLIVVLAIWGKHPRINQFFLALGPPFLALNCILFISHYWVA